MTQTPETLNQVQLELLKLYATNVPDEDLLAIRRLLVAYFAEKVTRQVDGLWHQHGWTAQDMREWAHGHLRATQPQPQ
jgi:alkyl sulfatase BDS1-like metallo-beta-lactamase superfamily hydrolase